MLLSIIIPSYQVGHELAGAFSSISIQAPIQYEIIVIDGGSSDNTTAIIDDFCDLPITFIQEPDAGVYDAMNKGVSMARGKWLYFMGGDDRLCNGVFEALEQEMQNNTVDIIYGNAIMASDRSVYDGPFTLDKLLHQGNICHQSVFYKKSIFDKLGGYNLRYKIWADWDFNIRCFKHPSLVAKYFNISVAIYNNLSGVSAKEDELFKTELPVFYEVEIKRLAERLRILDEADNFSMIKRLIKRNVKKIVKTVINK